MRVNVTKANHHYKSKDGVVDKAKLGEQDLPDSVAKAMIELGKAQEIVKPKAAAKKSKK